MLAGRFRHVLFLQIVGKYERGDAVVALGDPHCAVHQMAHLRRDHGIAGECSRHVLEHRGHVEFLLVMRAHGGARLLADDGQHRHVVHPRIVEPGQQMRGAGARGRQAHAQLAGELRMRRGHEGGHFLVAHLNEFEFVLHLVEGADKTIDAVSGIAEDPAHAPFVKALPNKLRYCLCHDVS